MKDELIYVFKTEKKKLDSLLPGDKNFRNGYLSYS